MMHISRISEELVLWSSVEFGFITLSDAYSTGSSIMPQKKNPDVPELLRGKSGRSFGNLMALLSVMKSLPLAYNKDTQEDKENVFDSVHTAKISLQILKECLATTTFHTQNMRKMATKGHLSATDLADFLVRECGIPFRDSHHITGKVVADAISGHRNPICGGNSEAGLAPRSNICKGVSPAANIGSAQEEGGLKTHFA